MTVNFALKSSGGSLHDADTEKERGAHLQLAQRHRKIVAGSFKGFKTLKPEVATPGVVGTLTLSFTTTGPLTKFARVLCQLPDDGWLLPTGSSSNVELQLPSQNEHSIPIELPQVKMTWSESTRTMEFTLLNESTIAADTPLVLVISGVCTPEKATPQGEAVVTSFEKLITRNTVPASIRGGQVVDGPTAFTISKIVPGLIGGAKRWSPFNCFPGTVSDVTLAFTVSGKVPSGGKLLVELPTDGWEMDERPTILLRTAVYHNKTLAASWDCSQHTLEICLGTDGTFIAMKSKVILTIAQVRNPKKETMFLVASSEAPTRAARLTTLSASGGVIDGPSKLEVARISQLREQDFEVLTKVLDMDAIEDTANKGSIAITKVPDLLRRAGLRLSDELYQSLVVPCFPVRDVVDSTNNESARAEDAMVPLVATGMPPDGHISREELLNVFAHVYAPAYKYGQMLRVACGRGHSELVQEWISRGCNPNAGDASGWSALHYTAEYGRLEVLDRLIELTTRQPENASNDNSKSVSLELNARDGRGWTPLMCAAANGHTDIVQKLLSLGASISSTSVEHRSALHWAASRGMTTTTSALLAAGADVHQVDCCGWTALHCAMLHGNATCASILIENGASQTTEDILNYQPSFYSDEDNLSRLYREQ